ncbi:MAG TPA: M20/M25/M40 family metallo-hydrolase, partial [Polyangiaceae bacterium]
MNRSYVALVRGAKSGLSRWIGPLCAMLGVLVALCVPEPPRLLRQAASGVSIERATNDWRRIASEPRPVGSPAHARCREYILHELHQQPVQVSVQDATAAVSLGGQTNAANVKNVLGRIAGEQSTLPAILLAAHYDSVPGSPGAVDDGAAVAALIETARVITAGPRLSRDVLLLFTDAEELGLLGAMAFVDEHPMLEHVGLVINFEARGNAGELLLFQTAKGDRELLAQFGRASRGPNANSLFSTLGRYLPNDTDITAFAERVPLVLGFAVAEGLEHYHGPTDDIAHAAPSVLADLLTTAVELARHFGDLERLPQVGADAQYFSLLGRWLISYQSRVATFAALGLLLFWIWLVRRGLRQERYNWSELRAGAAWAAWTLLAALLLALSSQVMAGSRLGLREWAARSPAIGVAVLLMAFGFQLALLRRALARHPTAGVGLGALSINVAIVALLGCLAPTASGPWLYSVALALLGWSWSPNDGQRSGMRIAALAVSSFALALFVTPTMLTAFRVAGPGFVCIPIVMSSLFLQLVLPTWTAVESRWMTRLGLCSLAAGGVLCVRYSAFRAEQLPGTPYLPAAPLVAREVFRLDPREASTVRSGAGTVRPVASATHHSFELTLEPSARARCVYLEEVNSAPVRATLVNGQRVHPLVRFSPEL